ncbi:MAG: hypothetical protein EHM45_00805 [Desulfobacteraceae bacterium]|nr:MAG: hypothetical protein EHM45_00805 [Desulfobacteraceae bacterium]
MSQEKKIEFEVDRRFDPVKSRHFLNGVCTVLHCHHYATLYSQLALDAVNFNGADHLVEASEDTFYEVLNSYYLNKGATTAEEKVEIARQYWQAVGMGLIQFTGVGKFEILAEMEYSHLDEGWLKKWGGSKKPVNLFTVGFVAAVAALVNEKPVRSFRVTETKSLVCGDEKSEFKGVAA